MLTPRPPAPRYEPGGRCEASGIRGLQAPVSAALRVSRSQSHEAVGECGLSGNSGRLTIPRNPVSGGLLWCQAVLAIQWL
jgi:hypothetical protein